MAQKIRTRYAPSPTGRMHVGNLRTALYAYLIAKHDGGDFILRIEDTDQERYVEGATEIIYRTLEKTGLIHDEGPDKDGGVGPYVQSERQKAGIYMEYAKQLVDKGEAYYCFCDEARLATLVQEIDDGNGGKKEISVYDKHCLHLSKEEVEKNLAEGKPFVIRQNNPTEGTTTFHDELYGDVSVENKELDDMVLIKSDGYPTYNFANVVDDHLMGITHVVRGNEYISSSPKYNRLYDAFGWEVPKYIHCPLITDEEHHKLSKRSGHSSFEDLVEQGFLAETVVNFVALLGWSPDDNTEIMSLKELVEKFDYRRINKSPAVFDYTKLKWMNGEYLKAMDDDKFYELAEPYMKEVIKKDLDLHKIAAMIKTRIEIWPDIAEMIDFFEEMPDYDVSIYKHKKMKTDEASSLSVLKDLLPILEAQEDYSNDALYARLQEYIKEKEYKNGYVLWPIRIAVSGKAMTPCGATEAMEVIGKDETLKRLKDSIAKLEA
ncbi:glutamate--tRNA ligase [Butyrivibrio sp. AD3002]|uniref:glutamate--tRNA ligase n=1 Tax=Butyrivibrio sp. AD3002 TaxID=1280670 RepID=UPI0003B5D050|nr:glutamate--tRNA ligase [Butyrivibrio sp. AD3002]